MKNKHMVLWGVVLPIISCAAVEPTRVENGLYINPTYQFSVRVPAGWEVSEEIPQFLKKSMSFVSSQKFKAVKNPFLYCINFDDDCIATKIDFHIQDSKVTGHNIVYKSDYGMFYSVSLILVAREKQHATSLRVFKTVVDSFQRR